MAAGQQVTAIPGAIAPGLALPVPDEPTLKTTVYERDNELRHVWGKIVEAQITWRCPNCNQHHERMHYHTGGSPLTCNRCACAFKVGLLLCPCQPGACTWSPDTLMRARRPRGKKRKVKQTVNALLRTK